MWMFIGILGALLFIGGIITSPVLALMKKPAWKKVLGASVIGLFLFVVGAVNDQPASTTSSKPQASSKTSYEQGLAALNSQDYSGAIQLLAAVESTHEKYQDAQNKLLEAKKALANKNSGEAREALKVNDFNTALTKLREANTLQPNQQTQDLIFQTEKALQAANEATAAKTAQDYKNSCQTISYNVLNKNPDAHKDKKVLLRGKIMQIQESTGLTFMLLSVTNEGYGIWDDNVAVKYYGKVDVYEEDIITVWGEVTGSFSYKSVAGWDITVPAVKAQYVSKSQ